MSCEAEFRYPTQSSPTASWLPSRAPTIDSRQETDDNFLSDLMADGRTLHNYRIGDQRKTHRLSFKGLSQTDKASFETFRAAVLGATFRFRDGTMSAGTYVDVRFSDYRRSWRQNTREQWDVDIEVQEV